MYVCSTYIHIPAHDNDKSPTGGFGCRTEGKAEGDGGKKGERERERGGRKTEQRETNRRTDGQGDTGRTDRGRDRESDSIPQYFAIAVRIIATWA